MNRQSVRIMLLVCLIPIFALQGFSQANVQGNDQNPQAANQGKPTQGNNQANQSGYSPFDSFPAKLTAAEFSLPMAPECLDQLHQVGTVTVLLTKFATSADSIVKPACIVEMVSKSTDAPAAKVALLTPGNVIILHVLTWKSVPAPGNPDTFQYQPLNGAWGFYNVRNDKRNLSQQIDASGTPYFYNPKHLYLIDINLFDDIKHFDPTKAEIDYSIQATPRQKQNQADLATLASALLKLPSQNKVQNAPNPPPPTAVWGIVQEVTPGIPLPYDLAVTVSLNSPQGAGAAAKSPCLQNSQDAKGGQPSQNACSVAKTITNYDSEYWDVSLGLAIPGPVETTYKSTTAAGSTTVTPSKVTHTDAYAFGDIYFLQPWSKSPGGFSSLPHINFGIPITSQSLHRPYVGMAEGLNFLTSKAKLGVPLSVFAGPVFMKQQIQLPGTTTLKWDRATKMIYGIELPISSITNYLKGGGSSKNSGSSKNGGSSGGGGNAQ
jgi:hypothetical protein